MELTLQLDDTPHHLVHLLDVHIRVILTDRIFSLVHGQAKCDQCEHDGPEAHVGTEGEKAVWQGLGAEVAISGCQLYSEV